MPILGQLRKRKVEKKTLSSQIQLILSIAALVLRLAIDFYTDPFRVSCGKSSPFVFYEENDACFTVENSIRVEKKVAKMTQNWRVKPSIFGGLKASHHVVSHEPSELMFWLLTTVKSNCFTGLWIPDVGQPPKSHTNSSKHDRLNWQIYDPVRIFFSLEMECLR